MTVFKLQKMHENGDVFNGNMFLVVGMTGKNVVATISKLISYGYFSNLFLFTTINILETLNNKNLVNEK